MSVKAEIQAGRWGGLRLADGQERVTAETLGGHIQIGWQCREAIRHETSRTAHRMMCKVQGCEDAHP
jgi:hypothetical protein